MKLLISFVCYFLLNIFFSKLTHSLNLVPIPQSSALETTDSSLNSAKNSLANEASENKINTNAPQIRDVQLLASKKDKSPASDEYSLFSNDGRNALYNISSYKTSQETTLNLEDTNNTGIKDSTETNPDNSTVKNIQTTGNNNQEAKNPIDNLQNKGFFKKLWEKISPDSSGSDSPGQPSTPPVPPVNPTTVGVYKGGLNFKNLDYTTFYIFKETTNFKDSIADINVPVWGYTYSAGQITRAGNTASDLYSSPIRASSRIGVSFDQNGNSNNKILSPSTSLYLEQDVKNSFTYANGTLSKISNSNFIVGSEENHLKLTNLLINKAPTLINSTQDNINFTEQIAPLTLYQNANSSQSTEKTNVVLNANTTFMTTDPTTNPSYSSLYTKNFNSLQIGTENHVVFADIATTSSLNNVKTAEVTSPTGQAIQMLFLMNKANLNTQGNSQPISEGFFYIAGLKQPGSILSIETDPNINLIGYTQTTNEYAGIQSITTLSGEQVKYEQILRTTNGISIIGEAVPFTNLTAGTYHFSGNLYGNALDYNSLTELRNSTAYYDLNHTVSGDFNLTFNYQSGAGISGFSGTQTLNVDGVGQTHLGMTLTSVTDNVINGNLTSLDSNITLGNANTLTDASSSANTFHAVLTTGNEIMINSNIIAQNTTDSSKSFIAATVGVGVLN